MEAKILAAATGLPKASESAIEGTVGMVVGAVWEYGFDATSATAWPTLVRRALGLDDPDEGQPPSDCMTMFRDLLRRVRGYHLLDTLGLDGGDKPGHCLYLPAPMIGHLLRTLRDAEPDRFLALHLIARSPRALSGPGIAEEQFTVWLPRCLVEIPEGELWDQTNSANEAVAVLIARYAAALAVSVLVSYAPRQLVFDYVGEETYVAPWRTLIEQAFEQNGGPLMRTYVAQVRARRAEADLNGEAAPLGAWRPADLSDWPADHPLRVLGIDAGGTSIKAQVFEWAWRDGTWEPKPDDPVDPIFWPDVKAAATAPPAPTPPAFNNLRDQVLALFAALRHQVEGNPMSAPVFGDIDAIGLAYPGPVADGVAVGVSGVFHEAKLGGKVGTTSIAEGNPHRLHKVDLAAVLRTGGAHPPVVAVLNDGDADILAGQATDAPGPRQVRLVFKEGTGVAFALYRGAEPVDLLAESAKMVLDLCGGPAKNDFQSGVLSQRVSKRKFQTLLPEAHDLLNDVLRTPGTGMDANDVLSRTLGAVLDGALQGAGSKTMPQVIADLVDAKDPAEKDKLDQAAGHITGRGEALLAVPGLKEKLEGCHEQAKGAARRDTLRELQRKVKEALLSNPPGLPARDPLDPGRRFADLSADEQAAIALAWVLGRWLADAIALAWEVYRMHEVRLAGGALRGATGRYIVASARAALEQVYAFDLDRPEDDTDQGTDWFSQRQRHGIKSLRIIAPRDEQEGGPLGAAIAAREGLLAALRRHQLRACRQAVFQLRANGSFSVAAVQERAKALAADQSLLGRNRPWIVPSQEIEATLEQAAAALEISRDADGGFVPFRGAP